MSPWGQRRATIDQMLVDGRLERVPANPVGAQGLIDKAQTHLGSAAVLAGTDVELAYDALHAANRKALTAVLLTQGLRPTRVAGHTGVYEAVRAQLDRPLAPRWLPTRGSGAPATPVITSTRCQRARTTCARTSRSASRSWTPHARSSARCRPTDPRAADPAKVAGAQASESNCCSTPRGRMRCPSLRACSEGCVASRPISRRRCNATPCRVKHPQRSSGSDRAAGAPRGAMLTRPAGT